MCLSQIKYLNQVTSLIQRKRNKNINRRIEGFSYFTCRSDNTVYGCEYAVWDTGPEHGTMHTC